MNLRHIAYAFGATISSVSLIVACSSSSSGGGTTPTDAGGGGKTDGTTASGTDSGGGGGTDSGGMGGGCTIADGTYTMHTVSMDQPDYDGGLCMSPADMDVTYPMAAAEGGAPAGCTTMTSTDGCTTTTDCTLDNAGYTTTLHTVFTINSDGTFGSTSTSKTSQDDGGAVLSDCSSMTTYTKK
jgi:hypothetical protein